MKLKEEKLYVCVLVHAWSHKLDIKVWEVELSSKTNFLRWWPTFCFRNYAPTIQVQDHAMREMGCQQVLWLFGDDHKLTEVGTMNLFMYWINDQGGQFWKYISERYYNEYSKIVIR